MTDKQPEAPKIKFPCAYHIKVIGDAAPDFKQFVCDVIRRHDPTLVEDKVTVHDSRGGKFMSARVQMHATGESQLKALFHDLKSSGRIHMVL